MTNSVHNAVVKTLREGGLQGYMGPAYQQASHNAVVIYFLQGIILGLYHLLNPKLRRLVLDKCNPVVIFLFKLPGNS